MPLGVMMYLLSALETSKYSGWVRGKGRVYTHTKFFDMMRTSSHKKNLCEKYDEVCERIQKLEQLFTSIIGVLQSNKCSEKNNDIVSACGITIQ